MEAQAICPGTRPLSALDVSTFLVQQITQAAAFAIGQTEHVRARRQPLSGDQRAWADAWMRERIACHPALPKPAA